MSSRNKTFIRSAKTTLILIYLVIVAGALVRMTGSGMGCPDWPKCFGYYIPPTEISQLLYKPGREFEEGQVIIRQQALWVAKEDFTAQKEFEPSQWRPYTKHDYAVFNPTHTWIEYINRLLGALAGLSTVVMAVLSLKFRRTSLHITVLSWLSVFLMAFQGWLGATVVYSVLNPVKITLHMLMALLIVAVVLYIIRKVSKLKKPVVQDTVFKAILVFALLLTLIQVILGTQVRQFVDDQVRILGYDQMGEVMKNPGMDFYIHRSLSALIVLSNGFLYFRNRALHLHHKKLGWVMTIILIEVISGIAMYYNDFPFGSQAFHLIAAAVLFGIQFYILLTSFGIKRDDKLQ